MNAPERNSLKSRRPNLTKSQRLLLLGVALLCCLLVTIYWRVTVGKGLPPSATRILVLNDCDADFRTPPFDDDVITFSADGKPAPKVSGFNIAQTVGGHRAIAVSREAGFFVVCENVDSELSAFHIGTGARLWSLTNADVFEAAAISSDGTIYALTSGGLIYGKDTLTINREGQVTRKKAVGGFDLALDAVNNTLWLVGSNITKCDLDLDVQLEVNCIRWCAVSIDYNPDGSVWVAEREHPNVTGSTNRIFKVSPAGQVVTSIGLPFSPACLRVDRSDGSIWVTGGTAQQTSVHKLLDSIERRTGRLPIGRQAHDYLTRYRSSPRTQKYDQRGTLLCDIDRGGFSLDVDPTDGALWIAGGERVLHYSRQGTRLGQSSRLTTDQRYIVVVPDSNSP